MNDNIGSDYHCEFTIEAPAAAVYDALVTPEGLKGWWSTDADVSTEIGGEVRLNWSSSDYVVFRIDRLARPTDVDWTCVAQHNENFPHPDEWVGTVVSFRLSSEDATVTSLTVVHHGLRPLECYEMCQSGWDRFLRRSLKQLVETGHGLPVHA